MNTDFIKGIIPPIITPITADEKIDEGALREQINFMIEGGIDGILAFGSNGEFYMLEEEEMPEILKIIMDETKGRIPVYMGIGAIRTSKCVRLAKLGIKHGASGVSVLQPMFLKPSDDELHDHFKTIACAVPDVPVLLYNNPGRTGYPIPQAVVEKLAHTVSNIVGMKDSSGDMTETMEFIRRNKDVGFKVLAGKDTLIYSSLDIGAVGAVCTTANYMPELVCSIYRKFIQGDKAAALEAQFKLNPIRLAMDKSSFPVATKDYANLRGRKAGAPYLPNKCSPPAQMENLRMELEKAGLL
ncbi:MAG: dihydrodipicolinate synthase family protein [Spirochaetes bacterium]|nr:dihydrodipicolinate synthase family protein [Spirochaetota bacterium]